MLLGTHSWKALHIELVLSQKYYLIHFRAWTSESYLITNCNRTSLVRHIRHNKEMIALKDLNCSIKKIKVTELMYTYYVCCLWSVCYIPKNASAETKRMNMKIPASLHNETRHTCSTLEALLGHFLQCDNTLDMELLIPLYLISYIYLLFIL